jgi:hypothetical protein
MIGQNQQSVDLLRNMIQRNSHILARGCLVLALTNAGAFDQARSEARGLLRAAEQVVNPNTKALALAACGWANIDFDPAFAYRVLRSALTLAEDSGSRYTAAVAAIGLSRVSVRHGETREAFDFLTHALRSYYDSGSFALMGGPLTLLGIYFDRLEYAEPAAVLLGFAAHPGTIAAFPEAQDAIAHLRAVLGDGIHEQLAASGAAMTNAAVATYAFEQIDRARAELQP